ncbi:hypothetical protein TNCV_1257501 [Trichonephila clavipes]|nr:hypothetical protein TNCV_1257501 [Trichonephila clavipes]
MYMIDASCSNEDRMSQLHQSNSEHKNESIGYRVNEAMQQGIDQDVTMRTKEFVGILFDDTLLDLAEYIGEIYLPPYLYYFVLRK